MNDIVALNTYRRRFFLLHAPLFLFLLLPSPFSIFGSTWNESNGLRFLGGLV